MNVRVRYVVPLIATYHESLRNIGLDVKHSAGLDEKGDEV
jgi:hypothetical protein